jgi:hypothetical protein
MAKNCRTLLGGCCRGLLVVIVVVSSIVGGGCCFNDKVESPICAFVVADRDFFVVVVVVFP